MQKKSSQYDEKEGARKKILAGGRTYGRGGVHRAPNRKAHLLDRFEKHKKAATVVGEGLRRKKRPRWEENLSPESFTESSEKKGSATSRNKKKKQQAQKKKSPG